MNIEIITTPTETLYETGFGNYSSCQNVLNSIHSMGHRCRINSCKEFDDLERVSRRKPDLVVLAVKYIPIENGKKIWLTDYFSKQNIAYSGSSRNTLEFDSDKILAKLHLQKKGISTAEFFTASAGEFKQSDELPIKYPLFLKPRGAANGNGIDDQSHVSSFDEFNSKVLSLQNSYNQPALAEEYLSGREYTVAIISTKSGELLVSAVEIIPPKSNLGYRILSEEIKKGNTETLKKITDNETKRDVNRMAFEAFVGLGAEGFARIDIKSNTEGKCYFMEVNLIPGMTLGSSYFPEACRIELGLSYDETIAHLVEYCLTKELKAEQRKHVVPVHQAELLLNQSI
jgi:D-alanine-D-alanine ligase